MLTMLSVVVLQAATQIDIPGPPGSYSFGQTVKALPNGNILITDPSFDLISPTTVTDAGAVFLYNGRTGALISRLTGTHNYAQIGNRVTVLTNGNFVVNGGVWSDSYNALMGGVMFCSGASGCSGTMTAANSLVGNKPDDYVPGDITPLSNGNYLVSSPSWDNGSIVDAGAVTFCDGTTGCVGIISAANSLVGSNASDQTGGYCDPCPRGIVIFPNGNYIVSNTRWNNYRGAVTFGSGTNGVTGIISSANSLVGSIQGEMAGYGNPNAIGVRILANNNYVVSTTGWNSGAGAATFCNGATGCSGAISAANSLTGSGGGDYVGSQIVALTNGNYVAISKDWDLSFDLSAVGAVTFCSGTGGCVGTVSAANSLIGSHPNDRIGEFGAQALTNGNYIVKSPSWSRDIGAVTFGNGMTGITGTISTDNSLVGTQRIGIPQDRVGERQFAVLVNGNYAVASEKWFDSRGAVTFINGQTGITGEISAANSLTGSSPGDLVGFSLSALTNGNYVVSSPSWDKGTIANVGAATFCRGTIGCQGVVFAGNSLTGMNADDKVSNAYRSITPLTNGNYVISSKDWNGGRGAATWGDGINGTVGSVSSANSLIGNRSTDGVGSEGVTALLSGNYVVNVPAWSNGSLTSVGAVTWGNGNVGTSGEISSTNSLLGNQTFDGIGNDSHNQGAGGGIYPLRDGNYVVRSRYWDNGSISNAGAVSLGKGYTPTTGLISVDNSVLGTYANIPYTTADFDYSNKQLIVGRPYSNLVTIFRYDAPNTPFDFDGDGKTDLSIFRPTIGEWWYLKSSDGGNYAAQFGSSSDKLTPVDFTGDGKSDVAFFRPATGEWFVLRSEDNSFYAFPFGANGDIPVPADFDADGKADAAVFRPSSSTWYIRRSSDNGTTIQTFGQTGDVPVVADYDGDGRADIAIYRVAAGEWWINRSTVGGIAFQFGNSNDKPVVGDYTGDGKADVAFFRPSTNEWFVLRSENQSYYSFPFGANSDIPAPGDYDGDGKFDATIFRSSNNTWYSQRTTAGILIQSFGQTGDKPVPAAFVP